MSEYNVGDKVIFDVWRSWKQTDTRIGVVFSIVSPKMLVVEVDNGKRFVVATDSIISHTPKEDV